MSAPLLKVIDSSLQYTIYSKFKLYKYIEGWIYVREITWDNTTTTSSVYEQLYKAFNDTDVTEVRVVSGNLQITFTNVPESETSRMTILASETEIPYLAKLDDTSLSYHKIYNTQFTNSTAPNIRTLIGQDQRVAFNNAQIDCYAALFEHEPVSNANSIANSLAVLLFIAGIYGGENVHFEDRYNVSVASASNGTCVANPTNYIASGTTINVTFTPDSGYSVDWDNVTITTVGAATVIIKDTETTGHFTMPAGDVTINPAFKKVLQAGVQVSGYGGQATVSNEHPAQGDTVTITCYPNDGYEVDTVTSFDATIRLVSTNIYEFTMPNVDVLATVTFKESQYITVTVEASSNGSISANPTSGYPGTTVNLTVAPNTGYQLRTLYVLAGTDSVPVTKVDDNHFTFTLPSFNVVVRSIFNKIGDTDPYSPGGNSEPSTPGGTGTFDNTTMPITPPAMPAVSIVDTGLYTIFSLTQQQLNGFTNYLWSDLFSLDTVTKFLNNATEHILSLHLLPLAVNATTSREIKFMGIGTGTSGLVVTNQYQQLDCGSVRLEEYYGSALDYNPWTKLTLYVPYCGEIALDPDEVMNQTVGLKYTIDILTGDCYANISVGGTTMYQMTGNCALRLPVSASNWVGQLNAVKSAFMLTAGVGAVAMGAVGAGMASIGAAGIGDAYRQGDIERMDSELGMLRAGQTIQNNTPQVGTTNSYMATMAQKSSFVHTGIQTGGAGFMSVQVPYILIKRPRQSLPENFNNYVGYPAHYTRTLGHLSGFTTIIDWNPTSIPCTESERSEIDRLLKTGVIL